MDQRTEEILTAVLEVFSDSNIGPDGKMPVKTVLFALQKKGIFAKEVGPVLELAVQQENLFTHTPAGPDHGVLTLTAKGYEQSRN